MAAAKILALDPKCHKVKGNPSACIDCPDNPQRRADGRDLSEVAIVGRLSDAVEIGVIPAQSLTFREFERIRIYRRATRVTMF